MACSAGHLDAFEILRKAPGVNGLLAILSAEQRRESKGQTVKDRMARLRAAIDAYAAFIHENAGSRRKLLDRIEATLRDRGGSVSSDHLAAAHLDNKQRLYKEAAMLTGQQSAATVNTVISRPAIDNPAIVESAWLNAYIGFTARTGAMPLRLMATNTADHQLAESNNETPGLRVDLLSEYCTRPLPNLSTKAAGGENVQVLDASSARISGVDVVTLTRHSRVEHPALRPPEVYWALSTPTTPTARLVLEQYLHRDLAAGCVPTACAYRSSTQLLRDPESVWYNRLPEPLKVEVLGPGLSGPDSSPWSLRQQALAAAFEQLGWRADEFVGYRLDVPYPIWSSMYVLWFDYRRDLRV